MHPDDIQLERAEVVGIAQAMNRIRAVARDVRTAGRIANAGERSRRLQQLTLVHDTAAVQVLHLIGLDNRNADKVSA